MPDEVERVYTIPLRQRLKNVPRSKRAPTAVKLVKQHIHRHMKADEGDVWIDPLLSEHIWSRGITNAPGRLRVRAIKFEDGIVEVSLQEE